MEKTTMSVQELVICADGNQSAKGIRTGKDTGIPDNTNRSKNSDSD